jgi:hypothetical protein
MALTREAERYYQHQVRFVDPKEITIWSWDGKTIVPQVYNASQAEEYFGLLFARQALDLDPEYTPAQLVALSLALDKAVERAGLNAPLAIGAPAVRDLVATVNPELLVSVLDRALADKRLPVILGAVRALGDAADPRAAVPRTSGLPPLVRALNYPDRRVQLAAADALLRIPGPPHPMAPTRIVEILRRAAASDPVPRAVVADFNKERGQAVAIALKQAGYDAGANEVFQTGRDLLWRLGRAADINVIIVDQGIVDPPLPYLLAQLRQDINVGRLPILVTVEPPADGRLATEQAIRLQRLTEQYRFVRVVPTPRDPALLKAIVDGDIKAAQGLALTEAERKDFAGGAMVWLVRLARGEVAGYDVSLALPAILANFHNDELAPLAIEAAARLPGGDVQRAMANLTLDATRDVRLRTQASYELARHLQQHGVWISPLQAKELAGIYAEGLRGENEVRLRANVAQILGNLRPDARLSGRRLGAFVPPPPAAAAPAAEKKEPEKKEPEKKDEKKDTDKKPDEKKDEKKDTDKKPDEKKDEKKDTDKKPDEKKDDAK